MQCPACNHVMIVLELDQVEVDYCTACKGIWLDPGELEVLLHVSGSDEGPLSRAINSGGRKVSGQKRRCPLCRTRMLQVEIEGPPRVVVDRCRRGHGLWLDDRELGQLIEAGHGHPESAALAKLCGRVLASHRGLAQGDKDHVGTDSRQ